MAKSKKKAITTGIVGEEDTFDHDTRTMKPKENQAKKKLKELKKQPLSEKASNPVWIVNKLPQACQLSYGGETIMVPPRTPLGKFKVGNSRLLGKLPKGVISVPIRA